MPNNPNRLSKFWGELKRRNVTRVLAVYIAAAFMILELVDIVSEPFGLPDWSLKMIFFILFAGFHCRHYLLDLRHTPQRGYCEDEAC
jgi:hypothetical protein